MNFNLNFAAVKAVAVAKAGPTMERVAFFAKKSSPEIFLGLSIITGVGAVATAIYSTTKAEEVVKKHQPTLDTIRKVRETQPKNVYSDQDYKTDIVKFHIQRSTSMIKLYAPSIALGAISIGCALVSHNIMSKRQLALLASLDVLTDSFKQYRGRMIAELGPEREQEVANGIAEVTTVSTVTGKNGKEKTTETKEKQQVADPVGNPYARWFSEDTTRQWQRSAIMNDRTLREAESEMDRRLHARGYLFLNEVYRYLGMDESLEGQFAGWLCSEEHPELNGDEKVSFRLDSPINAPRVDPIHGFNQPVYLDFNVDGPIYDKLKLFERSRK